MSFKRFIDSFEKVLKKGPLWALSRIAKEYSRPTFRSTRWVMNMIKKMEPEKPIFFQARAKGDTDYLTAVYDFDVHPVTFDFACFLIAAELFFRKKKKSSFVVVFVPAGERREVNEKYMRSVDEKQMQWRFENIIIPLIGLYPACVGYSVLPSRDDISEAINGKLLYPEFYDKNLIGNDYYREVYLSKDKIVKFSASTQGKRYVESWRESNKITGNIVSITLRRYGHDPIRNSNVDEWIKFARLIKGEGFTPVFIPDTDSCFELEPKLEDFIVFSDLCWNMGLRAAFYEDAYLNFFNPNGPGMYANFSNNIESVTMKYAMEESETNNNDLHKSRGLSIGQRKFDFVENYQVLSWEPDTFENISKEFYKFLAAHP
jgi:hypothetical protein